MFAAASAFLRWSVSMFFFFQAEDGIRDLIVTGVQTCASFFSSRRRHARSERDWSSDVCSSDLTLGRQQAELLQRNREVPAVELSLARLQRDAKVNDALLTLLKTRHQEALIKESEGVEEVSIVRPANEPSAPVGSETLNTVLVGGLLGLMLGLVLAFVQETLDTSIGTIEDVETYLDVPVLGIVPHIDPRETMQRLIERRPGLAQMDAEALQSHALLITHFDPKSPVAEAYRTLRTHVQFARGDHDGGKALVVTSPTLQEGKTTTIVNLALTMAQSGQKTLLVGANMRRPSSTASSGSSASRACPTSSSGARSGATASGRSRTSSWGGSKWRTTWPPPAPAT